MPSMLADTFEETSHRLAEGGSSTMFGSEHIAKGGRATARVWDDSLYWVSRGSVIVFSDSMAPQGTATRG